MVFKVSKGGVRSGNTLRGLRCMRLRRYSRHACIVARSNLPAMELLHLLESSIEDDIISSTLGSTNVLLSLNKKERWLLPGTVSDLIKTGSFKEKTSTVSLLERHKLKRRANCVSFVCNQGRIRHVTPRQKRYFSFNLENVNSARSNREQKRQKAKIMNAVKTPQVKIRACRNGGRIKTIDVFTLLGSSKTDDTEKLTSEDDISKSGYHLEVFYPCPSSCSLVYNPKYTDVHLEKDEGGMTHMKSKIKSSRARKTHRKRFTNKDMQLFAEDMAGDFTDDCYEDDHDGLYDNVVNEESESSSVVSGEPGGPSCQEIKRSVSHSDNVFIQNRLSEGRHTLEYLITQAEKTRNLPKNRKHRSIKFPSGVCSQGSARFSDCEMKSHIVYKEDNNSQVRSSTSQSSAFAPEINLYPARVTLPSAETDPDKLRDRFGFLYAEAECAPRRFVINMTENIQKMLSTSGSVTENVLYTSFLVFVHDGLYDHGLDRFNVLFNSNICKESLIISKNVSFQQNSVEEIMNQITSALLDLKHDNLVTWAYPLANKDESNFVIYDVLGVKVEAFHAHDEITRALHKNTLQERVDCSDTFNRNDINFEFNMFCDICYEDVYSKVKGVLSTQLLKCGHMFCDECWRAHCRTKVRNGVNKILCPGYNCNVTVGPVTLLSLLHVSEVSQMLQRTCEEEAESSANCKWCPNPECGRIIRLESEKSLSDTSLDVSCVCGHEFCFSCQSPPHWPASCDQTEVYTDKLQTLELPKEAVEERPQTAAPVELSSTKRKKIPPVEVEGRLCPKCLRFIEKNGGCPHISCKCGNQFCWTCLKQWMNHGECKPNSFYVSEYTRRVRIKHRMLPGSNTAVTQVTFPVNSVKILKSRQKPTMYQKALQQRLEAKQIVDYKQMREMVTRIARFTQRDLRFKRELLSFLEVQIDRDADVAAMMFASVVLHVTKFLRCCQKTRLQLLHVAEFTFVLIQDAQDSVDKRRALRLANDLSGYCSFIKSILELGHNQDLRNAVRRLVDIQTWARKTLQLHVSSVKKLRS